MKIKLDENLPASLVEMLAPMGHDAQTVPQERLAGRKDGDIWRATQREGRFLVTQDLDFSGLRRFAPGTHHGLLLVRLRVPGRTALRRRIGDIFRQQNVEDWRRCFVVATDHKLRIRRPGDCVLVQREHDSATP